MEDKLKSLVDRGKTIEVISKEMGISLGTVKRKLKSLGLKTKNAIKMRDEYNTTPIEKELLEDLISSGLSLNKISNIGKSLSSVRYWVKKYSFDDIVRYELDKCAILCANCHREVENGISVVAPPRIELGITD